MDDALPAGTDDGRIYNVAAGLRTLSIWFPVMLALVAGYQLYEARYGEVEVADPALFAWGFPTLLVGIILADSIYRIAAGLGTRWPLFWALVWVLFPLGLIPVVVLWIRARRYLLERDVPLGVFGPTRGKVSRLREGAGEAADR
ncbi:MAG: hypothetical protein U9R79_13895 [Armatimonadota bacterium]|nr:hypothetical protein [Armatimonadota bacterium]